MLDQINKATPAAIAFALATLAIFGMVVTSLSSEEGRRAIDAIGGFSEVAPVGPVLRWALALDMLLPIGYAAGFCLLALGRSAGRPVTAAVVCLFTSLGTLADFAENGAVAAGAPVLGFTFAKFGLLGIAVFLLGSMLVSGDWKDRILGYLAMIATPILLTLLMSGVLGGLTLWAFLFPMLGMLAFATHVSNETVEGSAA